MRWKTVVGRLDWGRSEPGVCVFTSSGRMGGEKVGRGEEGDREIDERERKERKRERRETAAKMERQKKKIKECRDRDRGVDVSSKTGRYGESETGETSSLMIILE